MVVDYPAKTEWLRRHGRLGNPSSGGLVYSSRPEETTNMPDGRIELLPLSPRVSPVVLRGVADDYERFANDGLPSPLEDYLADRYQLDLAANYAGYGIRNPWGKASGQLSMTAHQVAEDVEAGLGFVVLKTVIAQDQAGTQTMREWAIKEARMVAEPIVGASGKRGWTISWKGRGWWQSFDDYLQLFRDACRIAAEAGRPSPLPRSQRERGIDTMPATLIVPSCKYHLPLPHEDAWNVAEYEYTTGRLLDVWRDSTRSVGFHPREPAGASLPMPLEKDFSPTLAGSNRAAAQAKILEWLRTVPLLVRNAAPSDVRLGLKIFNALFDDDFQLEMLRAIHEPSAGRPDFYVYANRLFDPNREFDGKRGIAYGGPDLSDRNLRVMTRFQQEADTGGIPRPLLPWSATGDITTGKMALEYALRGADSFQLHTFFQLPADQYRMKAGSKIQKALHELYFHPQTGFIVWLHHLAGALGLPATPIRFRDVVGTGSH
jgi:hypothetical protein